MSPRSGRAACAIAAAAAAVRSIPSPRADFARHDLEKLVTLPLPSRASTRGALHEAGLVDFENGFVQLRPIPADPARLGLDGAKAEGLGDVTAVDWDDHWARGGSPDTA